MKKRILYMLLLVFPVAAYCQSTPSNLPPVKTDYLKKSKNQKTAAWLFLSGGFALTVTSALIAAPKLTEDYDNTITGFFSPEPIPENNYTVENILLVTGAASMLASIPFFIASKKNKRKAIDMSADIKMENFRMIGYRSFVQTTFPAVALKIKL